jgi:hypothetical protein
MIIVVAGVMSSCGVQKPLYNWKGYDDAVYIYTKNMDQKSIDNLLEVYDKLIDNANGTRQVPPPGVCADYGYLLIQKGKIEEGKALLEKEIMLYPESKQFIERIIKRLEQ